MVGWLVEFHLLRFVTPGFDQRTLFDVALKEIASLFFWPCTSLMSICEEPRRGADPSSKIAARSKFHNCWHVLRQSRLRAPRGAPRCSTGDKADEARLTG